MSALTSVWRPEDNFVKLILSECSRNNSLFVLIKATSQTQWIKVRGDHESWRKMCVKKRVTVGGRVSSRYDPSSWYIYEIIK